LAAHWEVRKGLGGKQEEKGDLPVEKDPQEEMGEQAGPEV